MFGGAFNRMGFNRNIDVARYHDFVSNIRERFEGSIGATLMLERVALLGERMHTSVELSILLHRVGEMFEQIYASPIEAQTIALYRGDVREITGGHIHVGKNMHIMLADITEDVSGQIHVGKDIHLSAEAEENMGGGIHVGKNIWTDANIHERVHQFIRIALQRLQTFVVDAAIPPGGEIRIDSNNFTVFLLHGGNTTNLRGRFSGDWVFFDRNTVRLYVENEGIQTLVGDAMYNDRWL